jgi:hypothetical protein
VLQKDLGPRADFVDKIMKGYNPNSSWQKTEEQHEESADSEIPQ